MKPLLYILHTFICCLGWSQKLFISHFFILVRSSEMYYMKVEKKKEFPKISCQKITTNKWWWKIRNFKSHEIWDGMIMKLVKKESMCIGEIGNEFLYSLNNFSYKVNQQMFWSLIYRMNDYGRWSENSQNRFSPCPQI